MFFVVVSDEKVIRICSLVSDSNKFSNMRRFQVFEEHIASPAEQAKAFMGSKSSKMSLSLLGSRSLATRSDVPLISYAIAMFPFQSPSGVYEHGNQAIFPVNHN